MSKISPFNIAPELTLANIKSIDVFLIQTYNWPYISVEEFNSDAEQYLNWVKRTLGEENFAKIYQNIVTERGSNTPTIQDLKDELLKLRDHVWAAYHLKKQGPETAELASLSEMVAAKEYADAQKGDITEPDAEKQLRRFQERAATVSKLRKYSPPEKSVDVTAAPERSTAFVKSVTTFAKDHDLQFTPAQLSHLQDIVDHAKQLPLEELLAETAMLIHDASSPNKAPSQIKAVEVATDLLSQQKIEVSPPSTSQSQRNFAVAAALSHLNLPLAEKVLLQEKLTDLKPAPIDTLIPHVTQLFDSTQTLVTPETIATVAKSVSTAAPATPNFVVTANELIQSVSLLSPSITPLPVINYPPLPPLNPREQPAFTTSVSPPPLASSPIVSTGIATAALQTTPDLSPKNILTATEVIKQVLADKPTATTVDIQNAFTKRGIPEIEAIRAAVRIQAAVATAAPLVAANALAAADDSALQTTTTTFQLPADKVQAVRQTVSDALSSGNLSVPALQKQLVDTAGVTPAQAAVISKQSVDALRSQATAAPVLVTPPPTTPLAATPLIVTGIATAALRSTPNLSPQSVASATEVVKAVLADNPGASTVDLQNALTKKGIPEAEAVRVSSRIQAAVVAASPFAAADALSQAAQVSVVTARDTLSLPADKVQAVRQTVSDALSSGNLSVPALQKQLVDTAGVTPAQAAVISKQSVDALRSQATAAPVLVTPPPTTPLAATPLIVTGIATAALRSTPNLSPQSVASATEVVKAVLADNPGASTVDLQNALTKKGIPEAEAVRVSSRIQAAVVAASPFAAADALSQAAQVSVVTARDTLSLPADKVQAVRQTVSDALSSGNLSVPALQKQLVDTAGVTPAQAAVISKQSVDALRSQATAAPVLVTPPPTTPLAATPLIVTGIATAALRSTPNLSPQSVASATEVVKAVLADNPGASTVDLQNALTKKGIPEAEAVRVSSRIQAAVVAASPFAAADALSQAAQVSVVTARDTLSLPADKVQAVRQTVSDALSSGNLSVPALQKQLVDTAGVTPAQAAVISKQSVDALRSQATAAPVLVTPPPTTPLAATPLIVTGIATAALRSTPNLSPQSVASATEVVKAVLADNPGASTVDLQNALTKKGIPEAEAVRVSSRIQAAVVAASPFAAADALSQAAQVSVVTARDTLSLPADKVQAVRQTVSDALSSGNLSVPALQKQLVDTAGVTPAQAAVISKQSVDALRSQATAAPVLVTPPPTTPLAATPLIVTGIATAALRSTPNLSPQSVASATEVVKAVLADNPGASTVDLQNALTKKGIPEAEAVRVSSRIQAAVVAASPFAAADALSQAAQVSVVTARDTLSLPADKVQAVRQTVSDALSSGNLSVPALQKQLVDTAGVTPAQAAVISKQSVDALRSQATAAPVLVTPPPTTPLAATPLIVTGIATAALRSTPNLSPQSVASATEVVKAVLADNPGASTVDLQNALTKKGIPEAEAVRVSSRIQAAVVAASPFAAADALSQAAQVSVVTARDTLSLPADKVQAVRQTVSDALSSGNLSVPALQKQLVDTAGVTPAQAAVISKQSVDALRSQATAAPVLVTPPPTTPLAATPLIVTGIATAALRSTPNLSPQSVASATEVVKAVLADNPGASTVDLQNALTKKGIPEAEAVRVSSRIQAAVVAASPFAAADALSQAAQVSVVTARDTLSLPADKVQAVRQTVSDALSSGNLSVPALQKQLVDTAGVTPAQAAVISKQSVDALRSQATAAPVLVTPPPTTPLAATPLIVTGIATAALRSTPNLSPQSVASATEVVKAVLADNPGASTVDLQNALTKKGIPEAEAVRVSSRIQAAVVAASPFAAADALSQAAQVSVVTARDTLSLPADKVQAVRQTVSDALSSGNLSVPALQKQLVDTAGVTPAQAAVISKQSVDALRSQATAAPVLVTPPPTTPLAATPLIVTGIATAALRSTPNLSPQSVASATEVVKAVLADNPGASTVDLQNALTKKGIPEAEAVRVSSRIQAAVVAASPFAAADALSQAAQVSVVTARDTLSLPADKVQAVRQTVSDALSSGNLSVPALQKQLVDTAGVTPAQAAVISKQSVDALRNATSIPVIITPLNADQLATRVTQVAASISHSQPVEFSPATLASITQTLSDSTISATQKHAQIIKDLSPHLSSSPVPITPNDTAKLFLREVGINNLPTSPADNLRFITALHLYHDVPTDKIEDITQKISSLSGEAPEAMVKSIKAVVKNISPSNLPQETYLNLAFAKTASPKQLEVLVGFYQQNPIQSDLANIVAKNAPAFTSLNQAIIATVSPNNLSPQETGLIQILSPQVTAGILSGNNPSSLTYLFTSFNSNATPTQAAEKLSSLIPSLSEYHAPTRYLHDSIHSFISRISQNPQEAALLANEITAFKFLNPQTSPDQINNFVVARIESSGLKISTENTHDLSTYISTFSFSARGNFLLEQALTSEFVKSGISFTDAQAIAREFIKTDIPLTTLHILQQGSAADRSLILKELSLHSLSFLSTNPNLNKNAINLLSQHFRNLKPEELVNLQNIYQQNSPASLNRSPLEAAQYNSLQFPSFILQNPLTSKLQNSATQKAIDKFFSTTFGVKVKDAAAKLGLNLGTKSIERTALQSASPGLVSKMVSSLSFSGQQRFSLISKAINKPLTALAQKVVSSAAVKAMAKVVASVATKIGLKVTQQAILQAIGSTIPGLGNLAALAIGFVIDVATKLLGKVYKFLRENIEMFIAGALALATYLISSSLALAAIVGGGTLLFTPVGSAFLVGVVGIITTLLATVVAVTLGPLVIFLIVVPIVVGFFLYVITTSSYVVPIQPTSLSIFDPGGGFANPSGCPLNGGTVSLGSYNPTQETVRAGGHGSSYYWNEVYSSACYSIPQASGCRTSEPPDSNRCNGPGGGTSCSYYGFAADIFSGDNRVILPLVNGQSVNWTCRYGFANGGGAAGHTIYCDNTSGSPSVHLVLTHLNIPSSYPQDAPSGTILTTLFPQGTNGNNTHVHLEVQIDGIWVRPESYFCS